VDRSRAAAERRAVIGADAYGLLDQRLLFAALAAALAGLVRGFSGFGAALTFIPLASIVYDPKVAIVVLWVIDAIGTAPLIPRQFREADWRAVTPLALGALATMPVGVWILAWADVTALRWGVSLFVLACTAGLASGWRYRRRPGLAASLGVGGVSGFFNGAVGVGGPPVVLFWLAGQTSAIRARANIFAYFALTTVLAFGLFIWQGLFTAPILVLAVVLTPCYMVPIKIGDRMFRRGTETLFRRVAFGICAAAGLLGLPIRG
jgi:uncharacterized membrane protein YfcA